MIGSHVAQLLLEVKDLFVKRTRLLDRRLRFLVEVTEVTVTVLFPLQGLCTRVLQLGGLLLVLVDLSLLLPYLLE